ncbi:LamG domain-containing protein [Halolamina salifodinae]|uniref:LamG-like jellyroll fold domain-containing protein n=1 Tax=Halolamina salifodinae TaxID=1202767 RepID=A0A8T4H0Z2_9EURY|nr:LamG-like jellyroll fold domain-containing protein [Halolamina salifodinae]MBP1987245.1 hypothetical protein [Halolamina salifodinae]
MIDLKGRSRRVAFLSAVFFAVYLVVSAPPVAAANVAMVSSHTTASELKNGTIKNAEVARSGEAGVVSHDVSRSSALARYTFDSGSGSTIYDSVGSNDATWAGSWVSTEYGSGVYLDGSSSADLGNIVDLGSENWTISVRASYDGTSGTVWSSSDGDINWESGEKRLDLTNDRVVFAAYGFQTTEVTGIDTSKTHTYTVSYNGSAIRVYVDGELRAVESGTMPSDNTGEPLRLGSGSKPDLNAVIDEFRVYQESLSPGLVHRLSDSPVAKLTPQANERWAMDASQGNVAYSDTGTRPATLNGTSWTSGISASALQFNASSGDYAHVTNSGGWDQAITLSAWINPNQTTTEHTVVDSRSNGGVNLRVDNSQFEWVIRDDSGNEYFTVGGNVNPDEWTHVMAVYNGSSLIVYQDGTQVASKEIGSITISSGGDLYIGNFEGLGTQYAWDGKIDEVRMYNSALTDAHANWIADNPAAAIEEKSEYEGVHSVTNSVSGFTDLSLRNATATVTWKTASGRVLNQTTISSSGNHTLTWSTSSSDTVEVKIEFDPTHPDHTARLLGEGVYAENRQPTVDDSTASPNDTDRTVDSPPITLSVDVSDPEFGTAQGDQVAVEFYLDGSIVGTRTTTSNGTVSYDVDSIEGGEHSWRVEVQDQYGSNSTSGSYSFLVPGSLHVRPIANTSALIEGQNVTVTGRFFSGELVFEKQTNNGEIDMTNLPADKTYVLVLEADGYYRRTVIVKSLFDQDSVYLLNSSKTAYYTEFVLNDMTGEYTDADDQTQLYIERPINTSDGLEWVTVAGDFFGAEGRFEADLEQNARYRIRLVNQDDTRILGGYSATREGTVTLNVGEVSWEVDDSSGTRRHSASYIDLTDDGEIQNGVVHFQYNDPTQNTSRIRVVIHESGNHSNEIMNSTFNDGYGTLSLNHSVTGNLTDVDWQVSWTAYNASGAMIASSADVAGGKRYVVDNPMGEKMTPVALTVLFLFVGTLFGGRLSSIGSVAVVGVAAVMWWLGWYTASGGVVVFAGIVAVAMAVGGGGRR